MSHFVPDKSFFRIGEVSRLTATKPFVLRYWETEFPMLQPVKSPKGHRLYRREDVETRAATSSGCSTTKDSRSPGRAATCASRTATSRRALAPQRVDSDGEAASRRSAIAAERDPLPTISRKVLLDLRDTLRAFLTLLETE